MLPVTTNPTEHLAEARKLNPNPYVELFEIKIQQDVIFGVLLTLRLHGGIKFGKITL